MDSERNNAFSDHAQHVGKEIALNNASMIFFLQVFLHYYCYY